MLRLALVLFLAVLVLPLGAWTTPFAAAAAPAVCTPDGCDQVAKPAKRCRGPALLGAPCGQALLPVAIATALPPAAPVQPRGQAGLASPAPHTPAAPFKPPRLA